MSQRDENGIIVKTTRDRLDSTKLAHYEDGCAIVGTSCLS